MLLAELEQEHKVQADALRRRVKAEAAEEEAKAAQRRREEERLKRERVERQRQQAQSQRRSEAEVDRARVKAQLARVTEREVVLFGGPLVSSFGANRVNSKAWTWGCRQGLNLCQQGVAGKVTDPADSGERPLLLGCGSWGSLARLVS